MCSLVILRRPGHPWPLLLAGNRDEMLDRPWRAPARHWDDRPEVVAGLDLLGGGSWMGVNDHGAVAVVMNRLASLGPDPKRRSRGELVLEALDHAEAGAAARALADLDPDAYRPFNLFLGDPRDALWVRNDGARIEVAEVPPGLHMLTAREMDDTADARIATYLSPFRTARVPDPEGGDWAEWATLLGARTPAAGYPRQSAMCFSLDDGFATLSSSLIAVPDHPGFGRRLRWMFAPGPADRVPFSQVY